MSYSSGEWEQAIDSMEEALRLFYHYDNQTYICLKKCKEEGESTAAAIRFFLISSSLFSMCLPLLLLCLPLLLLCLSLLSLCLPLLSVCLPLLSVCLPLLSVCSVCKNSPLHVKQHCRLYLWLCAIPLVLCAEETRLSIALLLWA